MWWGGDGKRWTEQDRMLTLALTRYEESLCPGCGQPKAIAYNPDAVGWFEAHELTCAGCAAKHEHANQQKKPTPGAKTYVVDTRPPEVELRPWAVTAEGQPAGVAGAEGV